jgi:hypothetical protein
VFTCFVSVTCAPIFIFMEALFKNTFFRHNDIQTFIQKKS